MHLKTNQKSQFFIILLIVFLSFVGISMPYLVFPALFLNANHAVFSDSLSESNQLIFLGVTLAAYPLGQFIGSPILGALSDEFGRKPLLSGTLFLAALCNLVTACSIEWQHLTLLIISRLLAGFLEGNIAIARAMAAGLKEIPKEKGFGRINAMASIAFIIGPIFGGILSDASIYHRLTLSSPFYIICLLFFALSYLSWKILAKGQAVAPNEKKSVWQRINLVSRLRTLFQNKYLRYLLITSTAFTLAIDIFYEFGPVHLTVQWGLEPSGLVLYNGILCLSLAIGNGWLPSFISQYASKKTAISMSIAAFAALMAWMVSTTSTMAILFIFGCSGLIIGLAVTLLTVKISNAVPDNMQGEVFGAQISLRVLGDALICLCGGGLLLISSKIILIFASITTLVSLSYYNLKPILQKPAIA